MFIYSMHASTIKFFAVVCLALTALITLIALVPSQIIDGEAVTSSIDVSYNFEKVKSAQDRIDFLRQFGWEVDPKPIKEEEVLIPAQFDKVFSSYNEIQRAQGLDLSPYKKKCVNRYTYLVKNYPSYEGEVYVNILVYRNNVIAGDVCSADVNGFIHGLIKTDSPQ